jgi:DNA-binding beta-propeller fold protein YncE
VDASGTLFVAELANNTIRKITPEGAVTTLAGLAGNAGSVDGIGIDSRFRNPWGLAIDASNNLYVADSSNFTIRKITPDGHVSVFAGVAGSIGSADGPAASARFWEPRGVAVDAGGNVYVSDSGNHTIRKISAAGDVTTLAGLAGNPGNVDGVGSDARFASPQGLTVAPDGTVYVADPENRRIRKITPDGVVSSLPRPAVAAGGSGFRPSSVAVDAAGNLYATDSTASVIWKILK